MERAIHLLVVFSRPADPVQRKINVPSNLILCSYVGGGGFQLSPPHHEGWVINIIC